MLVCDVVEAGLKYVSDNPRHGSGSMYEGFHAERRLGRLGSGYHQTEAESVESLPLRIASLRIPERQKTPG
jgi:hypothetical protein